MPVLSLEHLSISISKNVLVDDVNLEISLGEIHGLIGESGSGKSLTAMSILNLLPKNMEVKGDKRLNIDDREWLLNEIEPADIRRIRGQKVGFVFQDPMTSLNPSIRCGKQVGEVLKEHNIPLEGSIKKEVLRLFKKVKLSEPEKMYHSFPHEISGGQRQRIMIAMAVACKPKLLIADEPTTALDVTVQKSIIDLIDELRKSEGLAVLFISHDLGLIASYADRLSIMYKGKIVESGLKIDILKNPQHPYTKGLLACKPPIDKQVKRLISIDDVMAGKVGLTEQVVSEAKIVSDEILLEVENLDLFYVLKKNFLGNVVSEKHALKSLSFKIYRNQSVALVGESGSGKSTLGRSLLKLIESRSGKAYYQGKSILELSEKQFKMLRQRIQFIFQDPYSALNPKIIIGEAIMEPMKVHGIGTSKKDRKERCIALLKKVGLTADDFNKFPHQFSGGQRQRIVIARALTVNPEFIVCDEAVSALDVSVQAKILNLLKDLQEEMNLTYLFITHDMSVVRFFCDSVLVMKDGEIIERGAVDQIFEQPKEVFTKELIQASF